MLVNLVEKEVFGVISSANSDTGINVVFEKPDMGINLRHWPLVFRLSPTPYSDEVEEKGLGTGLDVQILKTFSFSHRIHVFR